MVFICLCEEHSDPRISGQARGHARQSRSRLARTTCPRLLRRCAPRNDGENLAMVWPCDGNMAYHTGIARRTVGRWIAWETRRGIHPRGLCARLSRHVLAACPCRERSRGARRGRSRPAVHRRLCLRQGQPRRRTGALAGAHRHAAAPRRRQGRGQVRADHLGRRRSTRSPRAGSPSSRNSGPLALLGYATARIRA